MKMQNTDRGELNKAVENWWNSNPFTLGLGTKDRHDLTGKVEQIDLTFFKEVERKMRKWWIGATYEYASQPLLANFVPYKSLAGKQVLDIAVGTGWSAVEMAQHGAHVTGIDITDEAIRLSKQHAELKGVQNVHFQKMDAQALTFPDAQFDFVLSWGCHMHMPDTEKSLSEVHRVLKPMGLAVSYLYNKSSWTYWFNFLFLRGILGGKLFKYRGDATKLVSRYTDGSAKGGNALTKVYTPSELVGMYRAAGFSSAWVVTLPLRGEVEGWPVGVFPVFKFLPECLRVWMGKKWAWGLVVMAVK